MSPSEENASQTRWPMSRGMAYKKWDLRMTWQPMLYDINYEKRDRKGNSHDNECHMARPIKGETGNYGQKW